MPQLDLHSATDFDKMSIGEYRPPASLPRSLQETSRRRQANAAKGTAIVLIERVMPKARDRLVTIGTDAQVTEAAELLFEPARRMVVVCDPAGTMVGVITRRDIIRQIRHCQGYACATQCTMIMTRRVTCGRPDDRLNDIWTVMKERELHTVPVIDSRRRPIGLLSVRDAVEALFAAVEYEEGLLRDYVMGVGYL